MRTTLLAATMIAALGCQAEVPPEEGDASWIEVIREPELQPWARLPEQHDGFRSVEVLEDRLIYEFSGRSPIEPMTVVAGAEGDGYIRYVESVETLPDGRIAAITSPAKLTELYRDMHVIIHFVPRVARPGDGEIAPRGEVAAVRAPLSLGSCSLDGGGTAAPFIEHSVTATFELELGGPAAFAMCLTSWLPFGARDGCSGVVMKAELAVSGSVTAGYEINAAAVVSGMCETGATGSRIRLASVVLYGIPVFIELEPFVEADASAMLDAGQVNLRVSATFSAEAKVTYQGGWSSHYDQSITGGPTFEASRAGGVRAEANGGIGVKIIVSAAGFAGPFVKVTAGVHGTFEMMPDGCNYTAEAKADLVAEFGAELTIEALGIDIQSTLGSVTLAERVLGSASGSLPTCSSSPETPPGADCDGGGMCRDDVFDRNVCSGQSGFQSCGAGSGQMCMCSGGSWSGCSGCMALPMSS